MTKKQKVFAVLSFLLTFALMCVIFYLSNQQAQESDELSNSMISEIKSIAGVNIPALIIRKAAHMCEYALLAFLFSNSFYLINLKKRNISALVCTFLYACSDELHQLFVPGRLGSPVDVLIDTSAAVIGIAAFFVLLKIIKKYRRKKDVRNSTVQSNQTS
jgi:VanZ family protein